MIGQWLRRTGWIAVTALMVSGCATNQKQRVAMLEEANRNLTDRLNHAHGDLDAVSSERDDLDRRLLVAVGEIEALRGELAAMPPTTEPTAEGWMPLPGGGAMTAIEGRVLFAPGKITLRTEARRTLDAIVSAVQGEYSDKDVLVIGHTDHTPIKKSGWADNYQLSTERALAVTRYLRDHGVAPGRLIGCGCGEHRARVPNTSEGNRATNRRVEIYAIDPSLLAGGS